MALISSGVFLIASILLGVGFNVAISNSFEESYTGMKLKEYGGFEYGKTVYHFIIDAAHWTTENAPVAIKATNEAITPYYKVARDISLIMLNATKRAVENTSDLIARNYPIAEYWVRKNYPVVRQTLYSTFNSTTELASIGLKHAISYSSSATDYLRQNVFVGKLSPDNLQRYTVQAFETIKGAGTDTFHWVYEKVQGISQ